MAQIMEFLLNLLLMKGKFLRTTAAETLHVAIKRCLQYKRKISTDYNQATQMINSFENMLEFINYNARHYRCEGKNFIVTNEVRYRLYEQLGAVKQRENNTNTMVEDNRKNLSLIETPTKQNTQQALQSVDKKNAEIKRQNCKQERGSVHQEKKKIRNQDYVIENLHAILKSQEFLFKNIIKLVNFFEKDPVFKIDSKKLGKIKKKLAACTDVLSNNTSSRNLSDLINNIIEEEITRCRFRHGESKTSAEISIKKSAPRGLEAALETRKASDGQKDKIMQELKRLKLHKEKKHLEKEKKIAHTINKVRRPSDHSETRKEEIFLKRSKSEPVISLRRTNYEDILKNNNIDIENTKNLIQKNEEHFLKFENALWHRLTSEKYLSLKDDYTNMCKCAFHNKRHFVAFESLLSKEIKQREEIKNMGKLVTISDTVFQILERKLVVEDSIPQEYAKIKYNFTKTPQENPFIKLQQTDTEIIKQQENIANTKKEKIVEDKTQIQQDLKMLAKEVKEKKEIKATGKETEHTETIEYRKSEENKITFKDKSVRNQETNTIINGNNLQKCLKLSEEVPEKNKAQLTQKDGYQKGDEKNSERILQIISINVPTDNFETEKNLTEKIKDTSTENKAQILTVDNSSVVVIKPEINPKLPEPDFKLQVTFKKGEPEQEKSLEMQDQDKNQNNEEKISENLKKSETFALLGRKREEKIKDIFLKTIEKEVANFLECDEKSQEIVKIKPLNVVNKADIVETDQEIGPISAPIKPEDFLLPLEILEKNEKKLTDSKLISQQNSRNEQESRVIFKSYETGKFSKNVSFPIVKNYEDSSTTRKDRREISTAPKPKEDKMRKDQEIKVVALLKENIASVSSKNTVKDKIEKKITETNNINKTIKIGDSGQQIYERSKKLRKIQESSFRLGIKKAEPTKITMKKQSFHPQVQHPKSKSNDQEKKKSENDGNNEDSLKIAATEKSKKHETKSAIPRLKIQQKKIEYVKMKKSETLSIQTIANADGKLFSIQGHPSPSKKTRTLSLLQLKNEAELLNMNKKVFDDLEATLQTVRIIMNKQAVLMGSNETLGNRKRKIDEPINKNFSTKPVLVERSRGDSYGVIQGRKVIRSNKSFSTKKITPISGKSKTFLKCVSGNNVESMEEKRPKVEKQLRRTTKTAIKKQQVLTIFPKISKSEVRAKPKVTPVDINAVIKQKGDGKSKVKPIPLLKTIHCDLRRRNTYSKKLSGKIECVKCRTDDTKVC